MTDQSSLRAVRAARNAGAALVLAGAFAACGGGSGGTTTFAVESYSVPSNSVWPINRPIEVVFSEPIDFNSVSLSTISIRTTSGVPAVGTFVRDPARPNVVTFVPRCPTKDDFSDAGLTPSSSTSNRIEYKISVIPASGSAPSVRSMSGGVVRQGQPRQFVTPLIDEPLDRIFLDVRPGPPQPIVRTTANPLPADARVTRVVVQDGGGQPTELDFEDGVLPGGVELPLNLYSDLRTHVAVLVEFDQPLNPLEANFSSDRIRLEYDANIDAGMPAVWTPIGTQATLVANCVDNGATVRLDPVGILPQGRTLRVRIAPTFQDLVGEVNPSDVASFAFMDTMVPDNSPLPNPDQSGDEVFESFTAGAELAGSLEDPDATFEDPAPYAAWGDGKLEAGFDFEGTGGPGGDFDLHIPAGQTVIFNTTSAVFLGGPGGVPVTQQVAVNGVLDVDDLIIPQGSTLLIQGPNPARILATGRVEVNGTIVARGSNNSGVVTLNTANIPEAGSAGQAGGGRGGKGSFLTTQSTPRGERGFGAFGIPGGGGEGGESGYSASATSTSRRPGGGGGGSLGPNIVDNTSVLSPCRDNNIVGLDVESGFPGSGNARGALHPTQSPAGGQPGPTPFADADTTNNFFGTMITAGGSVIQGELSRPWAGAGGGGGGDAVTGGAFPNPLFTPSSDEKGAGGGGGGGSLRIQALGDVVLGLRGRIDVSGGHGGGGENTNSLDRIGGGSGGGSGGHLIIETVQQIDLSALDGTWPSVGQITPAPESAPIMNVGLIAAGGQGGAGADNIGGAGTSSSRQFPCRDANPAEGASCPSIGVGGRTGAGGDGGPGLIQLHVRRLADGMSMGDIIPPTNATSSLFRVGPRTSPAFDCSGSSNNLNSPKNSGVIKPPPVGSPWRTSTMGTTTQGWDQLLPSFGPVTRARSKWISLGLATTAGSSETPEAVEFFFGGTDVNGFVQRTGSSVQLLPPVLDGAVTAFENGFRTAVLPAATLTDDIYQRNPALLVGYTLRMLPLGGGNSDFRIADAAYELGEFRVTVEGTGAVLAGFSGASFELIPEFFRLSTGGVERFLPSSASVQIEFQATGETLGGEPDETGASAWTPDITTLNGNSDYRFIRFRVSFDIDAGMTPVLLNADTPKPSLDFLKLPFRF